jgi:SAM-dependent methyltransferase
MIPPSPWVVRHASRILPGGRVLDLACGRGRHARLLAHRGYPVLAVDRDAAALASLHGVAGVTVLGADLEGADWPLAGLAFAGLVVTNYLWRPRLADIVALLAPGGVLIYETFMVGHEAYGKPSNPDFLLRPGELRVAAAAGGLVELEYFEGFTAGPGPAVRQAICALRP